MLHALEFDLWIYIIKFRVGGVSVVAYCCRLGVAFFLCFWDSTVHGL